MRGLDSLTGSLVLNDGVSEPESTFYPMYNVRQVEVLKGPASFLYGGESPGRGGAARAEAAPDAARFGEAVVHLRALRDATAGTVDGNVATADGKVAFRLNGDPAGNRQLPGPPEREDRGRQPHAPWRPDGKTRSSSATSTCAASGLPTPAFPSWATSGSRPRPGGAHASYQSPFDSSTQDVTRVRFDAERQLWTRSRSGTASTSPSSSGTPTARSSSAPSTSRGPDLRRAHPHLPRRHPEAPG